MWDHSAYLWGCKADGGIREKEGDDAPTIPLSGKLLFSTIHHYWVGAVAPDPPPDLEWEMSHCRVMSMLSFSLQDIE